MTSLPQRAPGHCTRVDVTLLADGALAWRGATVAQQVCENTAEVIAGLPTLASRGLSKFG